MLPLLLSRRPVAAQGQYLAIAEAAWAATQGSNYSFPLPVPPVERGRKWLPAVELADRLNVKRIANGVISAASMMCVAATALCTQQPLLCSP